MKQIFRAQFFFNVIALLIFTTHHIFAIEPLPENLESASPEEQDAYIEKEIQTALEEKKQVALRRFEERQNLKKEAANARQVEMERRIQQISSIKAKRDISEESAARNRFLLLILAIMLAVVSALLWYYSKIGKKTTS